VGVDLSHNLLSHARKAASRSEFVAGNALRLPFVDESFDLIVAVAILHHLGDLQNAFVECNRIAKPGALLIFFEPNKWNIFGAVANKLHILDIHTKGERPLALAAVEVHALNSGWEVIETSSHLATSFLVGYFLKVSHPARSSFTDLAALLAKTVDGWIEKVPLVNKCGSTLFAVLKKMPRADI
jgi:ubiquinone/menaquinone biosynthesis C-methylase UbiE